MVIKFMSGPAFGLEEIKRLESELFKNPNNVHILSDLAHRYTSQCDYASAIQHYEKIVRIDTHNGKAWIALGHCYLLKGDYHKCFNAYQSAIKKSTDSRDPHLWYGVGLLYSKFDSFTHAESAFQSVLKYDPNFDQKHDVLYKLGAIYKQKKKFLIAINFFNNAIQCPKISFAKKIQAMCNIGSCRESEGNFNEAFKNYYDALKIAKNSFKVREYIGFSLMNQKFYQEALEMLGQALAFAKENCQETGDIYYLMGRCHLEMKNFLAGIEAFQKAIYKNPCVCIYWISTGILYALSNQPQDAFECFVKASEFNQENDEVWFNMGIIYEQCKQKQEACLAYQRCYKLNQQNTKAKERKSKLKQQEEDYENIPSFVHPYIEISEVPFSSSKNEAIDKKAKKLPDITKFDEKIPTELEDEIKKKLEDLEKTATFEAMDKDVTSLISDIRPSLHNLINIPIPDEDSQVPMSLYVRINPQFQTPGQSEPQPGLFSSPEAGQTDNKSELIQPPPASQPEIKQEVFPQAQAKAPIPSFMASSFQNFLKSQAAQEMPSFFNPAMFSPSSSAPIKPPISNPFTNPNSASPFSPPTFPHPFNSPAASNPVTPFNPSNPIENPSPMKPPTLINHAASPSPLASLIPQNPPIPSNPTVPPNNLDNPQISGNPPSSANPPNLQEIPNFPKNPLGIPPPTPQQWAAFKNFMMNPMMAAQMMFMGSVGFMNFMKFMKAQARNTEEALKAEENEETVEEPTSPQKRVLRSNDTPAKKRKL
ncbi:unnamed protein product [Blepharisma stoltei]|uniref:Uncharacterized protein n=1 Tax=Blepharisma stoltei TaxID=1481888 RepID=A0AAU9JNK3_9CILI|nr:unnamed protein product [Blepharisma stoltei]